MAQTNELRLNQLNVRVSYTASTDYSVLDIAALKTMALAPVMDTSNNVSTKTARVSYADLHKVLTAIPMGEYVAYEDLLLIYPSPISLEETHHG